MTSRLARDVDRWDRLQGLTITLGIASALLSQHGYIGLADPDTAGAALLGSPQRHSHLSQGALEAQRPSTK